MRYARLSDWLIWQEKLHPTTVDLGLERVRKVAANCQLLPLETPAILVSGTNGKGSTVAILRSILRAQGYRVGSYTSPHLLRYNERVSIDETAVEDYLLCEAFDFIDRKRYGASLSFFEFGTLAALYCFKRFPLDVVVMEVGLGGRLDAVNIIEPVVSVITSIGIDHVKWLGHDREKIAYEKAGIMRQHKPVVCGDPDPPLAIARAADEKGADLYCHGTDFSCVAVSASTCDFHLPGESIRDAPKPALFGRIQLNNAATALMALQCIRAHLPVTQQAITDGLSKVQLMGRFEIRQQQPVRIFDVAHNPHSTTVLAENLRTLPCWGRTYAVFGVLSDKDVSGILREIISFVDVWCLAEPNSSRALRLDVLREIVESNCPQAPVYATVSVPDACRNALAMMARDDRLLVFGSMITVAEAIAAGV